MPGSCLRPALELHPGRPLSRRRGLGGHYDGEGPAGREGVQVNALTEALPLPAVGRAFPGYELAFPFHAGRLSRGPAGAAITAWPVNRAVVGGELPGSA